MRSKLKKNALNLAIFTMAMVSFIVAQKMMSSESGSERVASLGTPAIVKLTPGSGEQKILLNDPTISKNWGLAGTKGVSDIRVGKAWEITQCEGANIVAIVDTGCDVNHADLRANIWNNPGESGLDAEGNDKATNGVDDDGNGFVDDVHGWDFVNNKPYLVDNHGHGTHISGIVGASGAATSGLTGVCPRAKLMILKYYDPLAKNNDNLKNTIAAIRYAVKMGAKIINYSGGGTDPNDDEFRAVKFAADNGVLFVAAAGNERSNSDVAHYYPADYNLPNIISVTAIDPKAQVLKTSNYGVRTVHIAAPGEHIYSTLPNGQYGVMTGTSQATAFVTGVAALIWAKNKDFNFTQVKNQIISTADELPGLQGKTKSGGKLNSYAALAIQGNIPATGIAQGVTPSSTAGIVGGTKKTEGVLFGDDGNSGQDIMKALVPRGAASSEEPSKPKASPTKKANRKAASDN